MWNGRSGLEKLVPSRGRSHLIAPVADAKQCNTMPTKLERTSPSGQVYFRTKFGNTSLSAQCKHRQSQMPLFGTQLFLSEADVGTIYCRQHIRCAYRHTRSRSGIDWLQNFNCGLYLHSGYAIGWNIYRLIIKQRKPNVIEQYTPVISMYISDSHPVFYM